MEYSITNLTKYYPTIFLLYQLRTLFLLFMYRLCQQRNFEVCVLIYHYKLTQTLPPVPCEGLCNAQLQYQCLSVFTDTEKNYILMETWLRQFFKLLKDE